MKTIDHQAPGTRTRRIAVPAQEETVTGEASPESAAPLWFPAVPWLIPGCAVLIVVLTGAIWATML